MRRIGENISAWEIETVVNEPRRRCSSRAAHAVRSELGEDEVKVAVVLQPAPALTPEELLDYCQGAWRTTPCPRYVEFVEGSRRPRPSATSTPRCEQRGVTPNTWDRESVGYKVSRA